MRTINMKNAIWICKPNKYSRRRRKKDLKRIEIKMSNKNNNREYGTNDNNNINEFVWQQVLNRKKKQSAQTSWIEQ